ncbi:hypothetical protein DFQ29_006253 [Apophysomyces sp. BC1021]|nr:hypothetical protein DFQ29_006253 [Apophysomyces sp. BC1021]
MLNKPFADHFWESNDRNGIVMLVERMRDAKLLCEVLKQVYEARASLEEEYAKKLTKISETVKFPDSESGQLGASLECIRQQFRETADHHLQLSYGIKSQLANPLGDLLHKQRRLRKELQNDVQVLYKSRQLQTYCVLLARDKYNAECTKANNLIQKSQAKERRSQYMRANSTIQNLNNAYQEAIKELEVVTEQWNEQWPMACDQFELLEKERISFLKENLSQYANIFGECCESELQSMETTQLFIHDIDVIEELDIFVDKNGGGSVVPSVNDYINFYIQHNHHRKDDRIDGKLDRSPISGPDKGSTEITQKTEIGQQIKNPVDEPSMASLPPREVPENPPVESPLRVEMLQNEKETPVLTIARMEIYELDEQDDDDDEQSTCSDSYSSKSNDIDPDEIQRQQWSEQLYHNENEYSLDDGFMPLDQRSDSPKNMAQNHDMDQYDMTEAKIMGDLIIPSSTDNIYEKHTYKSTCPEDRTTIRMDQGLKQEQHMEQIGDVNNRTVEQSMNHYNLDEDECQLEDPIDHQIGLSQSYHVGSVDDSKLETPSGVHEELESMLRQLETQSRLSTRTSPRVKLSGIRQRRPGPITADSFENTRMSLASTKNVNFFDPFSTLCSSTGQGSTMSRTSTSNNSKWTAREVNLAMRQEENIEREDNSVRKNAVSFTKPKQTACPQFVDYGKDLMRLAIAVALFDYETNDPEELSFAEGDVLGIISKSEDGWWIAHTGSSGKEKQSGRIPSNYVSLLSNN